MNPAPSKVAERIFASLKPPKPFDLGVLVAIIVAASPASQLAYAQDRHADRLSAAPAFSSEPVGINRADHALRLAEKLSSLTPVIAVSGGDRKTDYEAELRRWNAEGNLPYKSGFVLPLSSSVTVSNRPASSTALSSAAAVRSQKVASGRTVFTFAVQSIGALRTRLHLEAVHLPADVRLWIYGRGEREIQFGSELLGPSGDIWTPSVSGDLAVLEVEAGDAQFSFSCSQVAHIVQREPAESKLGAQVTASCITDSTCISTSTFSSIDALHGAVAHLEFVSNGSTFICSGGLLNDKDDTGFIPYMLTANHCFSNQTVASTLEAFWSYQTSSCYGAFPNLSQLPRSNGSTLLATSSESDFTFVRLNGVPGNRWYLGWNANASSVGAGTTLYRVSHPAPDGVLFPQAYSATVINTLRPSCSGRSRPSYLYSDGLTGGVFGGSSGSPVVLANGQVVGQLFGTCGPAPDEGCDSRNGIVDGAFASTYPLISNYLDPNETAPTACVANSQTMCLNSNRFKVQVSWRDFNNNTGLGNVVSAGTSDSGLFWFFANTNWEMLVKVLNGCGVNNKFWVFGAATTNVGYTMTVTDTKTGKSKQYTNPLGTSAAATTDTNAFDCP